MKAYRFTLTLFTLHDLQRLVFTSDGVGVVRGVVREFMTK